MKKILFFFILSINLLTAQSVTTRFNAYGDISTITSVGNNEFDIKFININYGNRAYPDDAYDETNLFQVTAMWSACTRFPFVSVVSTSPIKLRFKDVNGALSSGDLNGLRVAIYEELIDYIPIAGLGNVADGNAGFIGGISPSEYT